jgi:hypothetical protein
MKSTKKTSDQNLKVEREIRITPKVICVHCESTNTRKISPEILLGGMVLYECRDCKERFYE